MVDIFVAQVTDVFRIGLLVGLLLTAHRTTAVTGTVLPLAAGILFVAVIIPTTQGQTDLSHIAVGLLSNAVILGILAALFLLYRRLRG